MSLAAVVSAFVLILPAELPDKTMVATLVLATRYRPLPVWCGVVAAFFIQCLVAVLAGHLITRLPQRPVLAVTAALFAIGAIVMFRSAGQAAEQEVEQEAEYERRVGVAGSGRLPGWQQGLASFGVLFAAEWGDLSQLATAGLVVRTGEPLSVFIGAWSALVVVASLAVVAGRAVLRSGPLKLIGGLPTVRRLAGGLFALLAIVTAAEAAGLSLPW